MHITIEEMLELKCTDLNGGSDSATESLILPYYDPLQTKEDRQKNGVKYTILNAHEQGKRGFIKGAKIGLIKDAGANESSSDTDRKRE